MVLPVVAALLGPLAHRLRAAAGLVPWRAIAVDLAAVGTWVAAVSVAFRTTGWPAWAYLVAVFGGVVAYSLVRAWR